MLIFSKIFYSDDDFEGVSTYTGGDAVEDEDEATHHVSVVNNEIFRTRLTHNQTGHFTHDIIYIIRKIIITNLITSIGLCSLRGRIIYAFKRLSD